MHVQMADEAICIGKAAASESYLRIDRIVSAAEITDVDAIHPGYGFLAENAHFADVCESCNIRFIGPNSRAMNALRGQGGQPGPGQESRRADPARFGGRGGHRAGRPDGGQAHRLPGDDQSDRGRWRAGHAGGPQRHFPGQRLSHGARRGGKGFRELGRLRGEVHREPAPHRIPDTGRQQGPHHPPGRTGLLDPAPQPEGGRRSPFPAAGQPEVQEAPGKDGQGGHQDCRGGQLYQRRHRRVHRGSRRAGIISSK